MKTALLFTLLFSTGCISLIAGTHTPVANTICLACNIPDGLAASDLAGGSATLTWNAVSGATLYTVEVQDEQNIPGTFHIETNVIGTSYTVAGLKAGVKYKFKVRARCASDKSDWSDWSFFAAGGGTGSGTGSCASVTGLNASVSGGTATLGWNAVSGALKYIVEVEDEQNTPSVFHLEDSTTTNSYTLTGLNAGVKYKFKVRTRCAGGQSDWSAWMFLNGAGSTQGGGSGVCTAPAILSVSLNGTSAKLSWNNVSGATQYYVEIEDEQNVPSNFHLEVSVQDSSYTVMGLQTGVLYKFKVSAHCAGGQSAWSNWLFFNGVTGGGGNGGGNATCVTPSGLLAANIGANSALLSWDAVPGAVSYTLEIERNQPAPTPWKITQLVSTNSFLLSGLSPSTRYKFKVRSNCSGGGNSDWTPWLKFKTASNATGTGSKGNFKAAAEDRTAAPATFISSSFGIQVYPNPVQTTTTVHLQNLSAEPVTLRLFDLTGHLVQEQQPRQDSDTWQGALFLGDLPNGLYLLQAQNGRNTQIAKVLVNH